MDKKLMLPIGIEDFRDIRTDAFYYVDKTALIDQVLDDWSRVTLFTRPRRFGKTLNMSMLKYFFEMTPDRAGADSTGIAGLKVDRIASDVTGESKLPAGTDEPGTGRTSSNRSLFEGLHIASRQDLCDAYMGQFPVIFVTLKSVEGRSYEETLTKLSDVIGREAQRFGFLEGSSRLTESDKDAYRALQVKKGGVYAINEAALMLSLKTLSELLYKHYGRKVIILIDEYDVPLDKAHQNKYYQDMVGLIRGMFDVALKTNEYLQFAVLTGCLRIAKESIFTGLNNFKVLTISDIRFDEQFGFTDSEVRQMLEYYDLGSHMDEVKAWYDGYRFGDADIYCPWDVINYVEQLRFDPQAQPQLYWINTSGNALLRSLIEKADAQTKGEIEQLVAGETIEKDIRQELTYDEAKENIENIWSVLYTTGYLTAVGRPRGATFQLRIPNEEIRTLYKSQVIEWMNRSIRSESNADSLRTFWQDFAAGDAAAVEKYMTRLLTRSISVFDTKGSDDARENSYHMVLMALLAANPEWRTRSNIEVGEGFADIIVETDDPDAGIVVELKHVAALSQMEAACDAAIGQIRDHRYAQYLIDEGREDIMLYGLAFCKKRCKARAERV